MRKAKAFQERHQSIYPELFTYHVNGDQSTNDRNVKMKEFAHSSKAIITNARCLTEGVDVPAIDVVYFCDPKNSKIDIVQATGRALRRADHKGKKFGYVVVPIFHREKEHVEEIIETGAFKNFMSVVRTLCSQDERLVDEIKEIKIGKGERQSASQHISINYSCDLITIDGFRDELRRNLFDQIISKTRIPYRNFDDAKKFINSLRFKSSREWSSYATSSKKPDDIPAYPNEHYKNKGWISWGDWLGNRKISAAKINFRSFYEAREFVRSLELKNKFEWEIYSKSHERPNDIPSRPSHKYKDTGWISMGDWLGTDSVATFKKKYRNFDEAKKFVHELNLKGQDDWIRYAKSLDKPDDIPANPYQTYKNKGWVSMGDWLGTGRISTHQVTWRQFGKAREFIRSLKLAGWEAWETYAKSGKKPHDIPTNPHKVYKEDGWISMSDWLGNGKMNRDFRSFILAREFSRSLALKGSRDWRKFCKSREKPDDIPAYPNEHYKNKGWISWQDWLGIN